MESLQRHEDIENRRLKRELSHVCWLLYETCREIPNNRSDVNVIYDYYHRAISKYGFPKVSTKYDAYYEGYWMKCVWDNHEDWLWMSKDSNTFKEVLNKMYWWNIENNKSDSEYIWDDYYEGWWIFSESDANGIEWIWWG